VPFAGVYTEAPPPPPGVEEASPPPPPPPPPPAPPAPGGRGASGGALAVAGVAAVAASGLAWLAWRCNARRGPPPQSPSSPSPSYSYGGRPALPRGAHRQAPGRRTGVQLDERREAYSLLEPDAELDFSDVDQTPPRPGEGVITEGSLREKYAEAGARPRGGSTPTKASGLAPRQLLAPAGEP